MRILYTTLFVVLLDQATKLSIKGFSIPFLNIRHEGLGHRVISVIGDFFQIIFVENAGMAFGIELNVYTKLALSVFSVIASIGLVYYLYTVRNQSFSLRLALALILAGAIGNLIDRVFYGVFYGEAPLFYGKVVDFLSFDTPDITLLGRHFDRFPIFNIADTAVTIGVAVMLLFYKKHEAEVMGAHTSAEEPEQTALLQETPAAESQEEQPPAATPEK